MALIALCTLILCSCRSPNTATCWAPQRSAGQPDLAGEAYAGGPAAPQSGAVVQEATSVEAAPGMEQGVPMPYSPRGPWAPPGIRQPWPADEYLRDGGDEGLPAMVSARHELGGVEPEDTVAVYQTPDGETRVEPSNEVFLYAPRFGAVRQVVSLMSNEDRNRANSIHAPVGLRAPETREIAANTKQNVQLGDQTAARPPVALRTRQGDGAMSGVIGPHGFQNAFRPYENLSIIRLGAYEEAEMAFLARGAKAAIAWEHTEAVQVCLGARGAMAAVKFDEAMSVYTVSQPPGRPKLQLVKVASTAFAEPGDVIDFTIRFDNLGNEPLDHVVIVDSLSPRLEYVSDPKSTQCSVEARFSTVPNRAGSLVVRCTLDQPLQPGQGGILRFQCRVR
jgi:uncharacterized repeat protein (TIGR01451 family)